jgi:uncharacterized protein
VVASDEEPVAALVLDVTGGVARTVYLVANPEKLACVRAFIRTWDTTCKLKRIRDNPEVEVRPCTASGRPTGPAIRARARVLDSDESAYAAEMLARKYPLLHGVLIPRLHRLRGNRTMHIELTPLDG